MSETISGVPRRTPRQAIYRRPRRAEPIMVLTNEGPPGETLKLTLHGRTVKEAARALTEHWEFYGWSNRSGAAERMARRIVGAGRRGVPIRILVAEMPAAFFTDNQVTREELVKKMEGKWRW